MPFMLLAQTKKDSIKVFYLGGQSNMEGFGYVKKLPESLKKKNKDFFIYQGNPVGDNDASGGLGKWDVLQPGHGTGFLVRWKNKYTFRKIWSGTFLGQKVARIISKPKTGFHKICQKRLFD